MNDSGKQIKTTVFVVFGFVVLAALGHQISAQVNPPSAWSPYYWFTFGVGGALLGWFLSE